MKKFMLKRFKNEKGLTLVELLAVIVILGIVSAIAVPSIGNVIENSKYNAVKADAINVLNAANLYFVENADKDNVLVSALITDGFLENSGAIGATTEPLIVAAVTKDNPNRLTTGAIDYSGSKKVTFTNATITLINADNRKGSGDGGYTIPGPT